MHIGTLSAAALLALSLAVPVVTPALSSADEKPDEGSPPLVGLWASAWGEREGDALRFYYFHDEGRGDGTRIGLYRYGKVGLNQTNSFDWRVDGDTLSLTFRKTGAAHATRFTLVEEDGVRVLVVHDDPRDVRGTRYRYVPPPPLSVVDARDESASFARMWTHATSFKTGGMGFAIYQMKEPALDGRGVGWFHQGDFDDWTTETLTYRRSARAIELHFTLRDEHFTTPLVEARRGDTRVISLARDPRNFWHTRAYEDGGRSFAAQPLVVVDDDAWPTPARALQR